MVAVTGSLAHRAGAGSAGTRGYTGGEARFDHACDRSAGGVADAGGEIDPGTSVEATGRETLTDRLPPTAAHQNPPPHPSFPRNRLSKSLDFIAPRG